MKILLKFTSLTGSVKFSLELPQVPRAAIEGLVPPAAAVHPAERRAHLQDQRDVHQRHQAVPVRGPVQERRVLGA